MPANGTVSEQVSVDLVVDGGEGSWEDLVRDLLDGPLDPARTLTACGCGGCGCACCLCTTMCTGGGSCNGHCC